MVEMLTYSALLVMLFGLVYSVLSLSLSYYRQAEDSGGLQNEAMVGLNRLMGEMAGAPATCISADSNGVVFLSARTSSGGFTFDSGGNLQWQRYVCYYLDTVDGRKVLRRKEKALTATATLPTSLPTVASLKSDGSLKAQTVALDIDSLTVTVGATTEVKLTASSDRFNGSSVALGGGMGFRQ